MKLTTSILTLITCFVLLAFASVAHAGTVTANLDVSVDVDSACVVATTAVGFPIYEPITANFTNPDDSNAGSVTITCTVGTVAAITISTGNHAVGSQSKMSNGADFLDYTLYQDAGHSTVWGNAPNGMTVAAAPSTAPRMYPVYGRIPGGQSGGSGHYTDTVVAIVNF